MADPTDAIRDLQWLARTHPEVREICDKAITALLIQQDKLRKMEAER